ncbi:MAG: hypothetical protein ACYDHW_15900 [Syntrophorhabdaceae bacterium]
MNITNKIKRSLAGIAVFAAITAGTFGMVYAAEAPKDGNGCCGKADTCSYAQSDGQDSRPQKTVADQFEWNKRIIQGF